MRFLGSLALLAVPVAAFAAGKLEYNRDVRPILAENCFACHGPDSAARKADLRLDQRDMAMEGGAIVPGKPDDSPLVERIYSTSKSEVMPPQKTKKSLTDAQKAVLKQWIAEGAEYQAHWSFIPPGRLTPPAVKNEAWVKTPIDRFILAKLEAAGLTPAPEADRRTLARRLSLDIRGVPPTPAEVEEFINDKSPEWYENYVEKLMKSPDWGEHRGRYWLDAARYADTHGIHFDNYREMWAYREWVIKAFNQNMKFDEFTVEQLAGDLLPKSTLDQQIASGFNRCNITTNEGGAIDEEYLVLYARDRTETASQVWMGLTTGCAVCHNHKFDPITQKDFYSLSAFFNNTTQRAMDGNIKDTPPILVVPSKEDRTRWETLVKELEAAKSKVEARKKDARSDFDKWLAGRKPDEFAAKVPSKGLTLHVPLTKGEGRALDYTLAGKEKSSTLKDGFAWQPGHIGAKAFSLKAGATLEVAEAGDFDTKQAFSYGCWVKFPSADQAGAIFSRMDNANNYRGWDLWYENGKVGTHIVNTWPGDALKVVTSKPLNPASAWHHVFVTYDGSGKGQGVEIYVDGEPQATEFANKTLKPASTIKTTVPFKLGQRSTAERLKAVLIEDARIYDRKLDRGEVHNLATAVFAHAVISKPDDKRTPQEKDELFAGWLTGTDPVFKDLNTELSKKQEEEAAIKKRSPVTHVMSEKAEPAMAFVLNRGEYDKRKDKVTPDVPKSLPAMPSELPKNRLGLAQWLLRPDHPLTARVTVNRFWQELYGTGIVRTSGDFGVMGELPSHPELLDWLAVEFREGGWDVKRFFKLLVMSATYRQAAVTTPEKKEKDPHNRLMSRGPRFRMDAEMIRDYALSASGLLVNKLGGPSVKPYQPPGVWEAVAMIGSNTRDYRKDSGDNLYRRSMYTFWKRAAPPASMDILNAPNRETCTVRRERTNTPLQALVTLNDPQFVEAARTLAQAAMKQGGEKPEQKIDFIAQRLLSRSLTAPELAIAQEGLTDLLAEYKSKPDEAKKLIAVGDSKADAAVDPCSLAAWTMLTNQLMNLDEVLNK
jgi:mono/diheme cytochrome c family protein